MKEFHIQESLEIDGGLVPDFDSLADLPYTQDEIISRLVDFEPMDPKNDTPGPEIEIVGEQTISISGAPYELVGSKTFLFNVLRINQGQEVAMADFVRLGFPGERSTLSVALAGLVTQLNELSGAAIAYRKRIAGVGRPVVGSLSNDVRIRDVRPENPEVAKGMLKKTCALRYPDGRLKIQDDGSIAFNSPKERRLVTHLMFMEYRDRAGADTHFVRTVADSLGRRTIERKIMPMTTGSASREEAVELLGLREEALKLYLSEDGPLNDRQERVIIDGVRAGYTLFAKTLKLVRILAWKYTRESPYRIPVDYADLYQEGAAQLMEAIYEEPFDKYGERSFWHRAGYRMISRCGQGMLPFRHKNTMAVSTAFTHHWAALQRLMKFRNGFVDRNGFMPDIATMSKETSLSVDTVVATLRAIRPAYSYDAANGDALERQATLEFEDESDSINEAHDAGDIRQIIADLLSNERFDDLDKIMLSLRYGLFLPALCGTTIPSPSKDKTTFTYPDTQESFDDLAKGGLQQIQISELLGRAQGFAGERLARLHAAARRMLIENPDFTMTPAQQAAEKEREELRQSLVARALELSPKERIGAARLRQLNRQELFPVDEGQISLLFGSLVEFQRACGFEPSRQYQAAQLTREEVIEKAVELSPDKALITREIKAFSEAGRFVSFRSVMRHFESMAEFQRACEEEIARRRMKLLP